MSLFGIKKPSRRQFRRRVVEEEDEEEGDKEGENAVTGEVEPKAVLNR